MKFYGRSRSHAAATRRNVGITFVFQQNSASAHRARELLEQETPDFISLGLWLPNSPDRLCVFGGRGRRTRVMLRVLRIMLHVFRVMLHVFLVMLQVFPIMLHVFPIMLQMFPIMLHVFCVMLLVFLVMFQVFIVMLQCFL